MGCEDMKNEDGARVRMGLSLAWKAILVNNYEDSILCNRLYVTLDPLGVYINRRVLVRRTTDNHTIGWLLGFSLSDLVVDLLLYYPYHQY